MEKKFKLGVIGGGKMSRAIINGAVKSGYLMPNSIIVSDISEQALKEFNAQGIATTTDNSEILNRSEYVLFAVKPQHFKSSVSKTTAISCKKFITIMAGVKKSAIKSEIADKTFGEISVVRCMPNTPCSVGSGAVGIDLSEFSDSSDADFVKGLFSSFAKIVLVKEEQLNAVTGVSGSSPAYFYYIIKCLAEAGVKQGLSYKDAETLAVNTMIGSGKMIFENADKTLDELIEAVCSKGGTTIEAIRVFKDRRLDEIISDAVSACVLRAEELENIK